MPSLWAVLTALLQRGGERDGVDVVVPLARHAVVKPGDVDRHRAAPQLAERRGAVALGRQRREVGDAKRQQRRERGVRRIDRQRRGAVVDQSPCRKSSGSFTGRGP